MKFGFLVTLFLLQGSTANTAIDRAIRQLKPCRIEVSSQVPAGWRSIELAQLLKMSIPGDMARQSDSSTFCLHGCDQWAKDGLVAAVSYGLWGPTSFSNELWATACVLARPSVSVIMMQQPGEQTLVVLPRPRKPNVGNDTVVNLKWSTEEERGEVLRIPGSIRR